MDGVCFHNGLSFQKLNMMPKNAELGPVMYYPPKQVYPDAYEIKGDGYVRFQLYLPGAHQVSLKTFTDEFVLEKKEDIWTALCRVGTGFIGIFLNVDGNSVLYPALPIGFGGNSPINYIEVPEEDAVILPGDCPCGTVSMEYFRSEVTKRLERIYVYLPPDYFVTDEKYPVLYLQHGHGENETAWVNQGKMNFIYDSLIAQGKAKSAIVVMCNGMTSFETETGVCVSPAKMFPEMLIKEIIPYIESKYRAYGDKAHRAMAGLSMGSMQTSVVTLENQDLFDYVGIFSGFVTDFLSGYTEHTKPELLMTYGQNMKYIFRAMGREDIFMEKFLADDRLLEQYQVKHERVLYDGAHEWKVWQHCLYDFAQKIFGE